MDNKSEIQSSYNITKPNLMAQWTWDVAPSPFDCDVMTLIAVHLQSSMTFNTEIINGCNISEIPIDFRKYFGHLSKEELIRKVEFLKLRNVSFSKKDKLTKQIKVYKLSIITGYTTDSKGNPTGVIINEAFRPWILSLREGWYKINVEVQLKYKTTAAKILSEILCKNYKYPKGVLKYDIRELAKTLYLIESDDEQPAYYLARQIQRTCALIEKQNAIKIKCSFGRNSNNGRVGGPNINQVVIEYKIEDSNRNEKLKQEYEENCEIIRETIMGCCEKTAWTYQSIIDILIEAGGINSFTEKCKYYRDEFKKHKIDRCNLMYTLKKILAEDYNYNM